MPCAAVVFTTLFLGELVAILLVLVEMAILAGVLIVQKHRGTVMLFFIAKKTR